MATTTVLLNKPMDFGEGLTLSVRFVDSKYRVDENRDVHIQPDTPGGRDPGGYVATFPFGQYRSIVRGIISPPNADNEVEVTQPPSPADELRQVRADVQKLGKVDER